MATRTLDDSSPLRVAVTELTWLLGIGILFASGAELPAQGVTLELVPSSTTLSGCAEEELAVTLRLRNPDAIEIAGYQAFLQFPAEQFRVVAYDDPFRRENVYVQAPEPFGDGFRACTQSLEDPWDDGLGSDTVSVVVSLLEDGEDEAPPLDAPEVDLGRFVFRATGVPSAGEGAVFRSNDAPCHFPFDQITKVFSRDGESLLAEPPAPASVVVNETDPQLTFFRCEDRAGGVDLFWGLPSDDGVAGVRLFRNGEQLANILLRSVTSFTDETPVTGGTIYEAAILLEGELGREGCRLTCSTAFRFLRGDANGDGRVNLTDSVAILGHLFQGMPIECTDAGDVNDSGRVDLSDAVAVLDYLFRPGSSAPSPPFPDPGVDPTPDTMSCR